MFSNPFSSRFPEWNSAAVLYFGLQHCDLQEQKSEISFQNNAMPEAKNIKFNPLGPRF
jgi:hypothetical protein